jgi:hypothetical protein
MASKLMKYDLDLVVLWAIDSENNLKVAGRS